MQGQVDAGRRLAGARHRHQDHVGIVVVHRDAIVMGQGEVHRVDAAVVGVEIDHAVGLADPRQARAGQLAFQRLDERCEHIQHQRPAVGQDQAQALVHAGVHHDRPDLVPLPCRLAPGTGFTRLFGVVDKRHAGGNEAEPGDLGQQAMPNGFSGDTGSI
ncbi:hypothetical protein G6F63_014485 [Rhizopus arrhizus]|nr:hypothetical protein G6F63_014485 [Rhizopus arrhizus]